MRLQSQPAGPVLRYAGPLDCFRQSIRADGPVSLYRGVSAPLLGAAVETSSLFFSYRLARRALEVALYPDEARLPLGALATAGAASGAFTSLLLTPIELVKCQMQAPLGGGGGGGAVGHARRSPLSVIASVYRHHGIVGFWRGQLGTLIRETGGSAAWFGSYEGVSALFRRSLPSPSRHGLPVDAKPTQLATWQQLLAGAAAGVSYNFVFYPADTIKSRMQTEEVVPLLGGKRPTFFGVGKALWQRQGLKGLYRGCGITVGRSAPSSAFIFAVYEGLRVWWG